MSKYRSKNIEWTKYRMQKKKTTTVGISGISPQNGQSNPKQNIFDRNNDRRLE